jgi:hypothetical protein
VRVELRFNLSVRDEGIASRRKAALRPVHRRSRTVRMAKLQFEDKLFNEGSRNTFPFDQTGLFVWYSEAHSYGAKGGEVPPMTPKNQVRAVRYRRLALAEPDKANAAILNQIADEAERDALSVD